MIHVQFSNCKAFLRCAYCGENIKSLKEGNAIYCPKDPSEPCMYVHKDCDYGLQQKLGRRFNWQGLERHFRELLRSLDADLS
jgi:hypothetical protein